MKTVDEWSLEFDLLWNNIASDKAPGLERYEKSVFLTEAQEDLVKEYFTPKGNALAEGIDDSTRRQSDFRSLICSATLSEVSSSDDTTKFSTRRGTRYYEYPSDAFLVLNEDVYAEKNGDTQFYTVVPLSYDEYARLMKKPYKYPPKGLVWRLITHTGEVTGREYPVIEIIGNVPSDYAVAYMMRYVKRPEPIILEDLSLNGLSIEGHTAVQTCLLPEHLHNEILRRAVMLAKVSWNEPTAQTQR